jgi:hypothetical protein
MWPELPDCDFTCGFSVSPDATTASVSGGARGARSVIPMAQALRSLKCEAKNHETQSS